jgi:hypothetical protein
MKKATYTPEEITAGLLAYDPANDNVEIKEHGVIETNDPKNFELPKVTTRSASQLLKEFLDENNILLSVSPPSEGIKTVSDGSVIFSAPKIIISYK